jgi:hypothetical protein
MTDYTELNDYILDRCDHQTNIIMESDWFDELIEEKVNHAVNEQLNIKLTSMLRELLGD